MKKTPIRSGYPIFKNDFSNTQTLLHPIKGLKKIGHLGACSGGETRCRARGAGDFGCGPTADGVARIRPTRLRAPRPSAETHPPQGRSQAA